jgi:hypothetical protein
MITAFGSDCAKVKPATVRNSKKYLRMHAPSYPIADSRTSFSPDAAGEVLRLAAGKMIVSS